MPPTSPSRLTALITGASSGIGRDYARFLAAEGYDLIITARRADRLDELAKELKSAFGVKVVCLPDDLADPAAPQRLAEAVKKKRLKVDYLVNNAGYVVPGAFDRVRWETQRDMLQVLVTAVMEMCHIFGHDMAARGYGRIVNIASVAAYMAGQAGGTLYAPSKSFVVRFSQNLAVDYRDTGVHVVAVCPGFTWSEFHDVAGNREAMNRLPDIMWLEGPAVVRESHAVVEADTGPVVIPGRFYKLFTFFYGLLPENMLNRRVRSGRGRTRDVRPQDARPAARRRTKKDAASSGKP